jgi:hypothetical protein
MTTRLKTRKPATKPATPETFGSLPYDASTASIPKLIARLRFLEADCQYHAVIGAPSWSKAVVQELHREECAKIISRLAKAVPDDFDDAMALLKFATSRAETTTSLGSIDKYFIAMLKNASEGFYQAHGKARVDFILRSLDERLEHFAGKVA